MKTRNVVTGLFLTALAAAGTAPPAQAFPPAGVPITTNPGLLSSSGVAPSAAIFAFSDAGDSNDLFLTGFGGNPIFNNHAASPGATVNLGILSGPQQFGINDLSVVNTFLADVPDVNGNFHAYYTANCNSVVTCNAVYQDFSEGPLNPAVATAIAGLPAGTDVIFVGWEDRIAGDWDYNDLIFAFTNLTRTAVPEPASMALLGTALLGFGFARRRRLAA